MSFALFAALVALGFAPAVVPKCTYFTKGNLWTDEWSTSLTDPNALARKPYAFNSRNEVAYYKAGSHPRASVEFQPCVPIYAGEPNTSDTTFYGRFKIQNTNRCLAVSNPSGATPYYLVSKPCVSDADMATSKSIPSNFWAYIGDDVGYSWVGASIPSKQIFQGPQPDATNCKGTYFVNATSPIYGYNYPSERGEPVTAGSPAELNRVHLYCPKNKRSQLVKVFNILTLLEQ